MRTRAARNAAWICVALWLSMAPSAHAGDPFFGTHTLNFSQPAPVLDAQLNAQQAAGVGTLREHIHWDRVERAPGVFDFAELDALVGRAANRGMTLLPILISTPQFYSTRPPGGVSEGWAPRDNNTMLRFAYELAHRYGTLGTFWGCVLPGVLCKRTYKPVTAWQIWNEPDLPSWWRTGVSPVAYTALLRAAWIGIKVGDPTAEVVLGGLSLKAILPGGYLDQLYDNGAATFFDTMALHPYGVNVSTVVGHIQRARAIMAAHGDSGTPLRISEYGFATGGVREWVTTEPCQAAMIAAVTRELSARRAEFNIRGIVQFQWQDRPDHLTVWPTWAGLFRADGSAKPAYQAFVDAVAGRAPAPGAIPAAVCPAQHLG